MIRTSTTAEPVELTPAEARAEGFRNALANGQDIASGDMTPARLAPLLGLAAESSMDEVDLALERIVSRTKSAIQVAPGREADPVAYEAAASTVLSRFRPPARRRRAATEVA